MKSKFLFGDIVVVKEIFIGVILKTWKDVVEGNYHYEVYVRSFNEILYLPEDEIERYGVRHKELNEEELEYQNNYIEGV